MPLFLPKRIIDKLFRVNSEIELKDDKSYIGRGDCYVYLPISEDSDEEDEYLKYDTIDGKTLFLLDDNIKRYKILHE